MGGGQFFGAHVQSPSPTSENPERCQDKNKESLFLKQELKFFSQIYQGQA